MERFGEVSGSEFLSEFEQCIFSPWVGGVWRGGRLEELGVTGVR